MKRVIILLAFLLSSCAQAAPTPAPEIRTVEVTRVTIQTVVVTQIIERVITATPMPTSTPTVTPMPFARWSPDQVAESFRAAGLEYGDGSYPMTKEDYGAAPMMAISGIRFFIPSLCDDCGGRILAFDDPSGLEATQTYYETLGKNSALFFSWVFIKDNILIQINGDLAEEKARLYEQALQNLGN